MNLGGDCSETRPVSDNDETLERKSSVNGMKSENNGSGSYDEVTAGLGSAGHVDIETSVSTNGKNGHETELPPVGISSNVSGTSSGVVAEKTTPPKGYGLKKWKRIRRDFTKDEGSGVDFSRILKRGLSNAADGTKPRDNSGDFKQKSEHSSASVGSSVRGVGHVDGSSIKGLSFDSTVGIGSSFAFGADSEYSGDQSSKSSTAASAPRSRHDSHTVMGSMRDRHRVKNPSGRSSGNATPKSQQVKGGTETGKKFRGERFSVENENSYSSVESDLRSSNVAMQPRTYEINKGRQSGKPSNSEEQTSGRSHGSNPQPGEDAQKDYCNENGGYGEGGSQDDVVADVPWEEKEGSENHPHAGDPMVKSMNLLQAAQEVLEMEIQKFGELGKEPVLLPNDFIGRHNPQEQFISEDSKVDEADSFDHLHSNEAGRAGGRPVETQLMSLNLKVILLESKLEEASDMLKVKEARVVELEDVVNRSGSLKEQSWSTLPALENKCREMETELEDLFKQKMAAEIEYLTIAKTTEKLKVVSEDQISLLEEQKLLSMEQDQMLQKLREAESKATVLKKHAEELDASCERLLGTEEVLKMQNKVCKYTFCLFFQSMLLLLALVLFLLQLFPQSPGTVPT